MRQPQQAHHQAHHQARHQARHQVNSVGMHSLVGPRTTASLTSKLTGLGPSISSLSTVRCPVLATRFALAVSICFTRTRWTKPGSHTHQSAVRARPNLGGSSHSGSPSGQAEGAWIIAVSPSGTQNPHVLLCRTIIGLRLPTQGRSRRNKALGCTTCLALEFGSGQAKHGLPMNTRKQLNIFLAQQVVVNQATNATIWQTLSMMQLAPKAQIPFSFCITGRVTGMIAERRVAQIVWRSRSLTLAAQEQTLAEAATG